MKIKRVISLILVIVTFIQISACSLSKDVALNLMIKDYEKTSNIEELGEIVVYTWVVRDYKNFQKYRTLFFDECINEKTYYKVIVTESKNYLIDDQQKEVLNKNPELFFNNVLWCYIISYLLTENEQFNSIKTAYEIFENYNNLFIEKESVNFYNSSLIAFSAWDVNDTIKKKIWELLLVYSINNLENLKGVSEFLSGQYLKVNDFEIVDLFSELSLWIDTENNEISAYKYLLNEANTYQLPDIFENEFPDNTSFQKIIFDC